MCDPAMLCAAIRLVFQCLASVRRAGSSPLNTARPSDPRGWPVRAFEPGGMLDDEPSTPVAYRPAQGNVFPRMAPCGAGLHAWEQCNRSCSPAWDGLSACRAR